MLILKNLVCFGSLVLGYVSVYVFVTCLFGRLNLPLIENNQQGVMSSSAINDTVMTINIQLNSPCQIAWLQKNARVNAPGVNIKTRASKNA